MISLEIYSHHANLGYLWHNLRCC
uniref:Uncharacterized protein n=1 Tax=Rhizophora mucronata TaxID=61149 RepID=A0A2P2PZR1_RHIMU